MAEKIVAVEYRVDTKDIDRANQEVEKLTDSTTRAFQRQSKVVRSLADDYANLAKMLHEQGATYREIAASFGTSIAQVEKMLGITKEQKRAEAELARLRQVTSQQSLQQSQAVKAARMETAAALRAEGFSYREVASQMKISTSYAKELLGVTKQVEGASKRTGKAWTFHAKKMFLWAVGAASAYRAYMQLRRMFLEGLETLYAQTQGYEDLTAAVERLKLALVASFFPADTAQGSFRKLTEAVDWLNQKLLEAAADTAAHTAVMREMGTAQAFAIRWMGMLANKSEFLKEKFESLAPAQQYMAIYWKRHDELLEATTKQLDEAGKAVDNLAAKWSEFQSVIRRFNTTLADHEQRINDINAAYSEAIGKATVDYYDELRDIEADLQKDIAKIDERALKSREKAYDRYYKDLAKLQARAQKEEQRDLERHQLEMEFARRRYNLSVLQNERMYQYERLQLVAEGDVLAIEDLDARYELERQAAEENYDTSARPTLSRLPCCGKPWPTSWLR